MSEMTQWHDWKVVEILGRGSYGTVYRIERKDAFGHLEQSALKVIRIPCGREEYDAVLNEGMTQESAATYFRDIAKTITNEFSVMSRLKGHSNIVSMEDYDARLLDDGYSWEISIRMELLTSLPKYFQKNPPTHNDIFRLAEDMCNAIERCELNHIIHRDIKPENIFHTYAGDYKLGDFGIARQLYNTSSATMKRGTVSYMAPEVFLGRHYDSTIDLYSLGIVLYRYLNNNRTPFLPPYPDDIRFSDREEATLRRINGEALPPPCNADEELSSIILKACAYRPEDRYQTAGELRDALREYQRKDAAPFEIYPEDENAETVMEISSSVVNTRDDREVEADSVSDDETLPLIAVPEEYPQHSEESVPETHTEHAPKPLSSDRSAPPKSGSKWKSISVYAIIAACVAIGMLFFICQNILEGNSGPEQSKQSEAEESSEKEDDKSNDSENNDNSATPDDSKSNKDSESADKRVSQSQWTYFENLSRFGDEYINISEDYGPLSDEFVMNGGTYLTGSNGLLYAFPKYSKSDITDTDPCTGMAGAAEDLFGYKGSISVNEFKDDLGLTSETVYDGNLTYQKAALSGFYYVTIWSVDIQDGSDMITPETWINVTKVIEN